MTGAKKVLIVGCCATVLFFLPISAQQMFDNWKITPAAEQGALDMLIANPATPLGVEAEMDYQVASSGIPSKATVKFKTGIQRAMTQEETDFFWSYLKGASALWNFMQGQGKINSFTSNTEQIPFSFLGRTVRVISNDNNVYVGTLAQNANTPEWFSLDIKGNRILFWRKAVKEIQQFK
jgi:hypothetical protein